MENRVVFIGMDQGRDELLYSSVKGKNPFKDVRVRKALYQAIDIETIKTKLMNGQAVPTGAVVPSPLGSFNDPDVEKRLPYDLAGARKLMADAGYADGFEVTLDCPNNRYINDEKICLALAAMWAQLKVKVNVNAMPRSTSSRRSTSSTRRCTCSAGAARSPTPRRPSRRSTATVATRASAPATTATSSTTSSTRWPAASSKEADPDKRKALIKQAFLCCTTRPCATSRCTASSSPGPSATTCRPCTAPTTGSKVAVDHGEVALRACPRRALRLRCWPEPWPPTNVSARPR